MKRSRPPQRRARLGGDPEKKRAFERRAREASRRKPSPISPASPAQRAKVRDAVSIISGQGPCHPAHLIDRSIGGCDHALCVIPLTPAEHRLYDSGVLDLLPDLERAGMRAELAHAVEHVGLLRALRRVSNTSWKPEIREEGP